ncbi:YdgA family protein [Colwellia echini]|uniref:DUF945 domain-containing protein n=1 Tax=Colwellia echini TaxID=1982103 RepID=A0ABY3N0U3_9GAMM|nr:DUF945 family protein [Colwellia echini]TYK67111.1 DUF945 domain-containing protein [Colwellia echini]
MKKIVIAVGVIVAGLLVAPKFIGSIVEEEREKSVMELNKHDDVILTTNQYTSSWFGADVSSELTFNLEDDGLGEVTVLLEEKLTFGPIIIADQGLQFGLGYSTMTFKLLSVDIDEDITQLLNEKIHLGALLGFNKNVTAFISTDEVSIEEDGSSIVSAPSSAQFTFIDNKEISGTFSWGGLELKEFGDHFVVGKVNMTTEQKVARGDYLQGTAILTGDANFKVSKMSMTSDNNTVFSLNDAELNSVVSLDSELLALDLKYHAKDITTSGQTFEQPNLEIVLDNIDINALQELNTAMENLPASNAVEYDIDQNNVDDVQTEELMAALADVAQQILAQKPRLKVTDLSVETAEGKVESQFTFTLNEDLVDTNNLNSMALIMALEADAKGQVPVGFLDSLGVTPMVDSFVEQGYFTKKDNMISFDAKYVQTQLTLNGKAFQM